MAEHPDELEADLQAHYRVDLRDLWRHDPDGVRRLTYRRLWVLIRHLPLETSALYRAVDPDLVEDAQWSLTEHLLDDVRQAVQLVMADKKQATKIKPHPLRPDGSRSRARVREAARQDPARVAKIEDARRRARERQAAIERGEIA